MKCNQGFPESLARGVFLLGTLLLLATGVSAQVDNVLASINGRLITERDLGFRTLVARIENPALQQVPDRLLAMRLLPSAIDQELLYQHFWRAGEDPDDNEVRIAADEEWTRLGAVAGSPLELDQTITRTGFAIDEFRIWLEEESERSLVVDRGIGARIDPGLLNLSPPSPLEAERVLLRQIMVSTTAVSGRTREEAHERALRIRLHIAEGLSFERAAFLYSDDDITRETRGAIGWIEPGVLSEEIRAALAPLSRGEVSSPALVGNAWLMFQVSDMETGAALEIAESVRSLRNGILDRLHEEQDVRIADSLKIEPNARPRD